MIILKNIIVKYATEQQFQHNHDLGLKRVFKKDASTSKTWFKVYSLQKHGLKVNSMVLLLCSMGK